MCNGLKYFATFHQEVKMDSFHRKLFDARENVCFARRKLQKPRVQIQTMKTKSFQTKINEHVHSATESTYL